MNLAGGRVLIVGAGGATRGVIAPLLVLRPAALVIANRTVDRAQELAKDFSDLGDVRGCGFDDIGPQPFDVIINATSASLTGEVPAISASVIRPDSLCYDMVYGKGDTSFLKWARAQGCSHAHQGLGMLVEQAAESFKLWRGVRPATARRDGSAARALYFIVTNSSAAVGWIATVSSKSCFVAPMRTATANPCSISSAPQPMTCAPTIF